MSSTNRISRCAWCGDDPQYVLYHDTEWGKPVTDDRKLFEFLILESAQAGLSWLTILRRREGYRAAFADFDVRRVAGFTSDDTERLMHDSGIIRNRKKIESAITNARAFLGIQKEFGSFHAYITSFLPDSRHVVNSWTAIEQIPASTPLSDRISRDMHKRGFRFFGTAICYAFLQATGFVNDHLTSCSFR